MYVLYIMLYSYGSKCMILIHTHKTARARKEATVKTRNVRYRTFLTRQTEPGDEMQRDLRRAKLMLNCCIYNMYVSICGQN